jgi:aspartate carbamoyltransferase catalytic subunit
LKIALVGDLKNGRTVHSLIKPFRFSKNVEFVFVAPESLQMPKIYLDWLDQYGLKYTISEKLDAIKEADVVYMTRIQQERFATAAEYLRYKGVYVIKRDLVEDLFPKGILMHPLPRIDEITTDCDQLLNSKYFEQPVNGLAVRMALIYGLLK